MSPFKSLNKKICEDFLTYLLVPHKPVSSGRGGGGSDVTLALKSQTNHKQIIWGRLSGWGGGEIVLGAIVRDDCPEAIVSERLSYTQIDI